jgi:ribokinase
MDALFHGGVELLVVTLGERGAMAFRPGRPPFRQPAFVVAAVDTVGAGDAFTAGLMAGLLAQEPLDTTLRKAAACGALTTCQFGAFDAFPTARGLADFLSDDAVRLTPHPSASASAR